jgi:lactoylglutathione lyase
MGVKVHVHLHVSDLAKSREFYRAFLGVAPVKDGVDYVKFLPEFAPLNLALTEGRPATGDGVADHLGIQVEAPADVIGHLARVKAAGLPVRVEMGVDCCRANQDKFWVRDPDGVEWEIYHLNYDLEAGGRRTGTEPGRVRAPGAVLSLVQPGSCCGDEP